MWTSQARDVPACAVRGAWVLVSASRHVDRRSPVSAVIVQPPRGLTTRELAAEAGLLHRVPPLHARVKRIPMSALVGMRLMDTGRFHRSRGRDTSPEVCVDSGESIAAFARRYRLGLHRLQWWRGQLKQALGAETMASRLVPAVVRRAPQHHDPVATRVETGEWKLVMSRNRKRVNASAYCAKLDPRPADIARC
jgi:hypothetical protein